MVVVLYWVSLAILEQCVPGSPPLAWSWTKMGAGDIPTRSGRQECSGCHGHTRKVTGKSGAPAAGARWPRSAGWSCQQDRAAGPAAAPSLLDPAASLAPGQGGLAAWQRAPASHQPHFSWRLGGS